MARHTTHKSTSDGKAQTQHRKARRRSKQVATALDIPALTRELSTPDAVRLANAIVVRSER